ncbi:hypothetical protein ACFLWF_00020 [Chloroflexota bacterium]
MKLSKFEQETVILFNQGDAYASIYTCSKPLINHLENNLGLKPTFMNSKGREYGLPKLWLRNPRKPRRLSEDEKAKRAERLTLRRILSQKTPITVGESGGKNVW